MVKIYKQPFAHEGDSIAIPDTSQPDGKMSRADGWTPDYQLPKTDPNYKPVGRREMNGVFKEVTEALGQVQVQGSATWAPDGAPYPINAQVYHNGKQWIALRANSVVPVEGEDWSAVIPQKTVTGALDSKADKTTEVIAGTGLAGGGNLSANRTLTVKYGTAAGTAAQGNDSRFSALGGLGREHTANAVFAGADNKISMTGIVSKLGLEVGDVIVFSNASAQNNKPRTVESINDDNNIIVNYEHCGARGNGSLKLADETKAGATAKLLAKWFVAVDGLGQDWVDVTAHRSIGTNYSNNMSRTVSVKIYSEDKITNKKTSLELALNGAQLDGDSVGSYSGASWSRQLSVGADIPSGSYYSFTINDLLIEKVSELR